MWYDNLVNAETVVVVGLVIVLLICVCCSVDKDISMSIASGLIGYIGRGRGGNHA